ncbi:MAG: hypothetical protein AB7N70_13920 [Dehalococcoidia bacterium]|jgi:hypothetical protein
MTTTPERDPQAGGSYLRDPKTGELVPVKPEPKEPAPKDADKE